MKLFILVLGLIVSGSVFCQSIDKKNPGYIRAMGTGETVEIAKNDAFKNAITTIVGTAVLSEKEAANNKMVRDDLINYSAGYIDKYEIVDTIERPNGTVIIIDIIVTSSKIHERLLNSSQKEKQIDGDRLSTQYSTYLNEQQTGDRYLNAILVDYPKRAFEIKQGNHEFKVDNNRNSVLIVPFELKWNYRYLIALSEALTQVQHGDKSSPNRITVHIKEPGSFFHKKNTHYFNDAIKFNQVKNTFNSDITLQLKINDAAGNTVFAECYQPSGNFAGNTTGKNVFVLFGNEVEKETVQLKIRANNKILEQAANIQLSVESKCFRKS
jgi:hypothetical protein